MLEIFSTREIASGLYLLLITIMVVFVPDVRKAFLKFFKAALVPSLLKLAIIFLFYGSVIIHLLSKSPYWKSIYIKDSILWLLFVGLPLCFGAMLRNKEESYYRAAIIDNLKYTVLFECFYATFTFDLLIELIIIPVIVLISMIKVTAQNDPKSKILVKPAEVLLTLMGCIMLVFTIHEAIEKATLDTSYDMIASLLIPLVFSIAFTPIAYLTELYSTYHLAFMRIGFIKEQDALTRKWRCIKTLVFCHFSVSKINSFMRSLIKANYCIANESEFNKLFSQFSDLH